MGSRVVVLAALAALALALPAESSADETGNPEASAFASLPWLVGSLAHPLQIELGFTYDDNVTRGLAADEILWDTIYSLNVTTGRTFPISSNLQGIVTGLLTGEAFGKYSGLAHLGASLRAELQYRESASYDAVTYGAFVRGWLDQYNSHLRDGGRYTVGVSARRALTDRIEVYGDASRSVRRAQSAVWDLTEYSARLNLDYSLGGGTLYALGEFHRGDTVSDGRATLVNVSIAQVFVLDDAFPGDQLFAYRYDAKTWVGMLGYSLPLGHQDSIDIAWRRTQATPTERPDFVTGSLRYVDNQYSIVYLRRF
jgi:hypothetical protein